MAKTRKTRSKHRPRISRVETTAKAPPIPPGAEAAYASFLDEAHALDARDVEVCRADVSLLYGNVKAGVDAILAERATIASALPKIDLDRVASLPDLALAVVFAAAQVDRDVPSDGTTFALLRQMRPLREKLLKSAVALAASGDLPAAAVDKILRGAGPRDAAQDCVDLAALFRKHAAGVKGKTGVGAADVATASTIGTTLLTRLVPKRGKRARGAPPEVVAAADVRDRLWTLLARDHDRLVRRPGFYVFGEAQIDGRVPALQAHQGGATKKATKTAATPGAPAPAAAATG